jgi:hypothetical protein
MAGFAASVANAQIVTLADGNSSSIFDPDGTGGQMGQTNWTVNGTNHMFEQWFWIRAGADAFERPISSLTKFAQQVSDTNTIEDPRADTLSLAYNEPAPAGRYQVFATFTLRGGAPGQTLSDITEVLTIRNTSNQTLPFSFFQYADFDINNSAGGDTGQIIAGRIPQQFEGNVFATEAVVTPAPTRYQIDFFPTIRNSLTNATITNLNNSAGPIGPGDLNWALQWDFTLAPGQEFTISKDKMIVPAPGALSLIGLAGLVGARRRRR